MKIGLAYDLKEAQAPEPGSPEDALVEYDSVDTIEAIAAALESQKHSIFRLGGGKEFLTNILQNKVDFVFNIAEGQGNYRAREAQIPSILEMLGIPYSGSDPQCLAICLDKPLTKKLVAMAGVHTPRWRVITNTRQLKGIAGGKFPLPAFIKPAWEGSSKGIYAGSKAKKAEQIAEVAGDLIERYRQPVMVEEFISGDEVTVGVVGNSPPELLGMMRILPKRKDDTLIYSREVKQDWEQRVDYECPAQLDRDIVQDIKESSLKVFQVLGCRDFARIDFRVSPEGVPYFLEINPLPGLNPKSGDLCIMANKMGWTYEELVSAILYAALKRYPQYAQK